MHSIGTTPANLDLTVSLFRITGGLQESKPIAGKKLHFSALAPGTTRPIDVDLTGQLAAGAYHVVARYTDATGTRQQLTSDFTASPHRILLDRIRQFFDRHSTLIILAIALIAVAILVMRLLRCQRRLESELRNLKAERARAAQV